MKNGMKQKQQQQLLLILRLNIDIEVNMLFLLLFLICIHIYKVSCGPLLPPSENFKKALVRYERMHHQSFQYELAQNKQNRRNNSSFADDDEGFSYLVKEPLSFNSFFVFFVLFSLFSIDPPSFSFIFAFK